MKLENLPRYSPDFDPIELCFSKLRQLLCRLFRESQGNAKRAIGMVLPSITPKDRGGYYGKCGLIDALDHDAEDEDGEMLMAAYAKARIKYDNKNVHTGGVDRVSMTKTVTKTIIITILTIMAGL